jgi:predicted transcriptional regulator
MLKLIQKQKIILSYYLEGISQRQIAKNLGIHRETVSSYIKEYEAARQKLIAGGNEISEKELIDKIVETPKYNAENREKRKLSDEIIEKIEGCLKENEYKKQIGQGKQQKKKIDIFEALQNENYDISYRTVCNAVNALSNRTREAFIKSNYELGDVCEFDWGTVKLFIEGKLITLQLSVFTSAKGNYRYARLFLKQDTLCFNDSHALFFEKIKGVYGTMVYDNTRVAVKKFIGITEKEPTEALLKLSIYYGFRFRFCNTQAGNEKGHVERSVEYIRRKAFAFRDHFESLDEANDYLQDICNNLNAKKQKYNDNKSAEQILVEEKSWMLPCMPMFDTAVTEFLRVDKYSTITVDTCHYSVPDSFVGKKVSTKIYSNQIICFFDGQKIAEHTRKNYNYEWSIEIEHYIKTLKRKPNALPSSLALSQAPQKLKDIYKKYFIKKEREFIELLQYIKEVGLEKVEKTIYLLERVNPLDISTLKIKSILQLGTTSFLTNSNVHNKISSSEIISESRRMLYKYNSLLSKTTVTREGEVLLQ